MTWISGDCADEPPVLPPPGLEGTDLDPATWVDRDAAELRALATRFEDLLDQLRARHAEARGDEVARRRVCRRRPT